MKPINLYSLISAYNNFDKNAFKQLKSFFGIDPKESELKDLSDLAIKFYEEDHLDLNNFFVGYKIPQINCEFDLLRFGKNKIINIELKRKFKHEKVLNQLLSHSCYLNFFDIEQYCYTFIAEEGKIYTLTQNEDLIEVTIEELVSELSTQEIAEIYDIDSLFKPSKFLVSPFNATRSFLKGSYVLTEHQQNIKKEIIRSFESQNSNKLFGVTGGPGTGKTLITYDIAKTFLSMEKKVLIIHCADLNSGQEIMNKRPGWEIKPISDFDKFINTINAYDLIVFDEAQRNFEGQFQTLVTKLKELDLYCIFSYDPKQCFSDTEFKRGIPTKIENELEVIKFELTETIRVNEELSSFIKNLFDQSKVNSSIEYKNIDIQFFKNSTLAKNFINSLEKREWEAFNYTGSWYGEVSYDRYQHRTNPNAHKIIGQEFDKVIGVIDENFYYDEFGLLSSYQVSGAPNYNMEKMLYQILTRARQKITLVIINNKSVFNTCLKVLGYPVETTR